jgi:hypothetical protein
MLRRHLGIPKRTNRGAALRHIECGPAPILFKPARALLAGIVQKSLTDVLPDRLGAIKADRVYRLDFDGTIAAPAGDAQHMALNFREMLLR